MLLTASCFCRMPTRRVRPEPWRLAPGSAMRRAAYSRLSLRRSHVSRWVGGREWSAASHHTPSNSSTN
eukprot:5839267-Prymnesium_polylepis.1